MKFRILSLIIRFMFFVFNALIECVGEVISEAYVLEYGTDCLEMHVGAVQPGERAMSKINM